MVEQFTISAYSLVLKREKNRVEHYRFVLFFSSVYLEDMFDGVIALQQKIMLDKDYNKIKAFYTNISISWYMPTYGCQQICVGKSKDLSCYLD